MKGIAKYHSDLNAGELFPRAKKIVTKQYNKAVRQYGKQLARLGDGDDCSDVPQLLDPPRAKVPTSYAHGRIKWSRACSWSPIATRGFETFDMTSVEEDYFIEQLEAMNEHEEREERIAWDSAEADMYEAMKEQEELWLAELELEREADRPASCMSDSDYMFVMSVW